jgi:hypothetical protein
VTGALARDRMRLFAWALVVVGLLVTSAVPAGAEPPTGFADLPWGTRSDEVFYYTRGLCTFLREDIDVATCESYNLPGVGQGTVYFFSLIPGEPDPPRFTGTLAGYSLAVPFSRYAAFRRLVVEKFGPPSQQSTKAYTTGGGATVSGEELAWRWPGVSAILRERCEKITQACLHVTTPALQAQQAEQDKRDREKAKKSF